MNKLLCAALGGLVVACVITKPAPVPQTQTKPIIVTPPSSPSIVQMSPRATNTINALNSSILIYGYDKLLGAEGGGSGVVVGKSKPDEIKNIKYYALTAKHVVEAFEEHLNNLNINIVYRSKAGLPIIASNTFEVVFKDKDKDVAAISFISNHNDISVSELATDEEMTKLNLCDEVIIVGCPLGVAPWYVTGEIVELFDLHFYCGSVYCFPWHIATNAPAYHGNSGGGLHLRITGKIIGIMNSVRMIGDEAAPIVNYSLRADVIRDIIKKQKIDFILENWSY